ncbi:MAG: phytoene synthase [Citrobacter freundii]|nr:MAG: phytoene synthase [Citrobacter freundii]
MLHLFHKSSQQCSEEITRTYSTSFASAIRLLHKDLRAPICNIYGFVRFADEIVDTFHNFDKERLLAEFKTETFTAIRRGISLNPVLHSFQLTVNEFNIDHALILAFFKSMEMDLSRKIYDEKGYQDYIYGSAEVVGLMCLQVFCEGKKEVFESLKGPARALGAAFQKVNFLRDIQADYSGLARVYFPCCDFSNFTDDDKRRIEHDIQNDFKAAYKGIIHLPLKARFGVYVAYKYYLSLFRKITKMNSSNILHQRVRIPDYHKMLILLRAGVKNRLRLITPDLSV